MRYLPLRATVLLALLIANAFSQAAPITDVFTAGQDGYHTYRIPSLLLTSHGVLLAFAEARAAAHDSGHIELVMKRSFDEGKTWGALSVVARDIPNAVGDPCPVLDPSTGTVFLLHTRNLGTDTERAVLGGTSKGTRTVWVMSTADDGLTWTIPREITTSVKAKNWTWYATGPGVGIQLRGGRLLIPCNHALAETKTYESHTIYSDDHGKNWQLGGISGVLGNESQAVELSDGSVMTNMRSYRGKHCRGVSISKDGGQTWTEIQDDPTLVDSLCQASLTRFERDGRSHLLFANPADAKSRRNLTLRVSDDDGKTWPRSVVIEPGAAAYNCLAVFPDDTVGCLFERGNYAHISFARLPIP
jgi:sialidase-1